MALPSPEEPVAVMADFPVSMFALAFCRYHLLEQNLRRFGCWPDRCHLRQKRQKKKGLC